MSILELVENIEKFLAKCYEEVYMIVKKENILSLPYLKTLTRILTKFELSEELQAEGEELLRKLEEMRVTSNDDARVLSILSSFYMSRFIGVVGSNMLEEEIKIVLMMYAKKLCELGPAAETESARIYKEIGEYQKALEILEKYKELDNKDVMTLLGGLHFSKEVKKDANLKDGEAFQCLVKASNKGCVLANAYLYRIYESIQDKAMVSHYSSEINKATGHQGVVLFDLMKVNDVFLRGMQYTNKTDSVNEKRAAFHLLFAASQQHAPANYQLGLLLRNRYKTKKAYHLAKEAFLNAARSGISEGYTQLGVMETMRLGGARNLRAARRYFQHAAKDDPKAHFYLGMMHYKGIDRVIAQRHDVAYIHFCEAAKGGDVLAMILLAFMFWKGESINEDKEKSRAYLDQAYKTNYKVAKAYYKKCTDELGPLEESKERETPETIIRDAEAFIKRCYQGMCGQEISLDATTSPSELYQLAQYSLKPGEEKFFSLLFEKLNLLAEQGNNRAEFLVSLCYRCGFGGIEQNIPLSNSFFMRSQEPPRAEKRPADTTHSMFHQNLPDAEKEPTQVGKRSKADGKDAQALSESSSEPGEEASADIEVAEILAGLGRSNP